MRLNIGTVGYKGGGGGSLAVQRMIAIRTVEKDCRGGSGCGILLRGQTPSGGKKPFLMAIIGVTFVAPAATRPLCWVSDPAAKLRL